MPHRTFISFIWPSALAMILFGLQLAVAALAAPLGIIPPGMVLAVFVVGAVAIGLLSWRSHRHQDELMRAMGRESGAAAFYLTLLQEAHGRCWLISTTRRRPRRLTG